MEMKPLSPRPLRRSGREMPPILWQWVDSPDPAVVDALPRYGAKWIYLAPTPFAPMTASGLDVVLGIPADALQARRGAVVHERLGGLGVSRCTGVMLQNVSPGGIKAGGPFHRLSQLRDLGTIELFFAEAEDHATAEWLLHHTPAHAISVPFSLHDLTPKYRLLRDAVGFGTGIIARPPQSAWDPARSIDLRADLSFLIAEEAITSILLPLPRTIDALLAIFDAIHHPMPDAERSQWWEQFQKQVPEPPAPPRGASPDFA